VETYNLDDQIESDNAVWFVDACADKLYLTQLSFVLNYNGSPLNLFQIITALLILEN